eukprot:1787591-Pleurochrysis_carterae.AAC.1
MHPPIYILRDLPGATVRELGREIITSYNICNHRSESKRGRRGWARLRGGSGSGALRRSLPWALRGLQNLGSEARALRKYACDASPIWEIDRACECVRLQIKDARDNSL